MNYCPELQNNYPEKTCYPEQICNHEQVCYFVLRKCSHEQKCHPEFSSGSNQLKIPKQVRNDNNNDKCHPEFIWQSEQTKNEFSKPAPRVTGSDQLTIMKQNGNVKIVKQEMLWKTRHFSRNQKISEKVVKQVRNDNPQLLCHPELVSGSYELKMLKQVQHDMKERNNSKTTERNSKMNIIKKVQKVIAFTLAETLVVMGIIGVVAALTIPNLNQSTGDREKVAKVKKLYANFEDAYGRATAVYGPYDEWFNGLDNAEDYTTRFGERFTEFMKTSKVCPVGTSGCFPTSYLNLYNNDSDDDVDDTDSYSFILADGTSVVFEVDQNKNFTCVVGLDGTKNRAVVPKNAFENFFGIVDNQMWPDGNNPEIFKNYSEIEDEKMLVVYIYLNPIHWILQNGNMDYLKLQGGSDGKCPNGKYLNWTTNTSCN